ncbi:hypothetical protein [Microtetraspora malaysiensis]|uniref:Secreted protein n=1 Tax=Microtetraspora malaysiensis TaxID=161358 RepID=A0ABW6SXB8_9ACTN
MRSSIVVLGLAAVIGVGTALPSAASATVAPASATSVASASSPQPWGPYRTSGRKAWAAGKASFTGSGLRVYGYLYDARGTRECSWLKLRGLSDRLKYRTVTYRNLLVVEAARVQRELRIRPQGAGEGVPGHLHQDHRQVLAVGFGLEAGRLLSPRARRFRTVTRAADPRVTCRAGEACRARAVGRR